MAYRVESTSAAKRELANLPRNVLRRADARIARLADDPRPPGAEKLTGRESFFRLRVGDYRIIYRVQDDTRTVVIARIRRRGQAYQRL